MLDRYFIIQRPPLQSLLAGFKPHGVSDGMLEDRSVEEYSRNVRALRELAIVGKVPINQIWFRTGMFSCFLDYAGLVSGSYPKNSSIKHILPTVVIDVAY